MGNILAFDLGASSGRAMLAEYAHGKLHVREIHRFSNDPVSVNGTLYWDILRLFFEIKQGISKAVHAGGFDRIGIDTWGVDFGLVGADGQLIANPVHYRDSRTDGYRELYKKIPKEKIYKSTGIQEMQINTLNQLAYLAQSKPEQLGRTHKLLFIPDLLNYFLTGEMKTEYTVASTSQLLDAQKRDWDYALAEEIGLRTSILCDIVMPGTVCGVLRPELQQELGAPPAKVLCIASHDTAAAVAALPTAQATHPIYISSGTWSLMGTVLPEPVLTDDAMRYNFTNEGGVEHTIRYLKNIMGTWLNQECRRQWKREGKEYGFAELDRMAAASEPLRSVIDVDASEFIKPGDMPGRIRAYCERTGQPVPRTEGEMIRCIDESLALKYRYTAEVIEKSAGIRSDAIHILGGGANSELLCQMTADATGKDVLAGPTEATVLGNIAVQLAATGEVGSLGEAQRVAMQTEEIKRYPHRDDAAWDAAYERLAQLTGLRV